MIRRLKVRLTYINSARERTERLVDPWGLVDKDSIWYLEEPYIPHPVLGHTREAGSAGTDRPARAAGRDRPSGSAAPAASRLVMA